MPNPNRLKVYYPYRCMKCQRVQHRGSSAKFCNLRLPTMSGSYVCRGNLIAVAGENRTKPPQIASLE